MRGSRGSLIRRLAPKRRLAILRDRQARELWLEAVRAGGGHRSFSSALVVVVGSI
jgi:hypothetical protein